MISMRKLVFAIALLLCIMFVIGQLAEVQAIADTLKQGDWRFILIALIAETAWLINVAASYRAIFQATGVEEKINKLILMSAAANFLNVVAPTAGMGGMAIFITEARQRGYSSGRVTVAGVLYVLFDYAGFLSLGLFVLFRRNNINTAELGASAILVAIALVLATLLYLGMRSARALGQALAWMARQVNGLLRPFTHREYLSEVRAYQFANDAAEGLRELRHNPKNLLLPILLALSNKILLITILSLTFLAFNIPFSVGTIIAGFSIAYLFLIVSPTPSGIGVVEGALTIALGSLYVPLGAAAVITLAYRGITFWIPLLFGLLAFRILSRQKTIETVVQ
jgi:uncharacterized protein (TIRG00374 family)